MRRRRAAALWAVAVTSLPWAASQEGAPPQCLPGDAKTCSPGLDLEDAHVAVRTAAAALWSRDEVEGRRRIDSSREALPNFYLDYVNETVRIAPPRPVAPCLGVQVVLGFCRGGAATVGAFQRDVLAPALQRSVPAAACSLNDAPPVQSKGGPSIAGSSILKSNALDAFKRGSLSKDRTVYVAMGEPNTRRELALAAAEHVTLLTQAELAWGIHAEPELQHRPTSYFLLLRDPISRLLSDYVAWRDEPPTSLRARHPLAVKAKKGIRAFAEATANYHLRFLGNDTRCAPRRSACASLTSFDQSLKRANAPRSPLSSAVATQPCHLDYGAEDARVFSCALATPENILREHLAYVKRNVHSLYFAVGLHERLAESMVLWRAAARHHDAQNWPAPACVPRLAPQAPARLRLEPGDVDVIRELNALDLELYDTIRAAFQMQLLSAKRHAGPGVAELLAAARNGSLPPCTPEPEPSGPPVT